LIIKGFYFF